MKKNYKFGVIILLILTVLGLTSNIVLLFRQFSGSLFDVVKITDIVVVLLTVIYTVIGYKKPHGNLLKTLMLIFATSMTVKIYSDAMSGWTFLFIVQMLGMMCIVYVAGRLNKVEQNKYRMPFILLLLIVSRIALAFSFQSSFDIMFCIGSCTSVIVWLDLCFAYFLRYKEHREAGLRDASKK